MKGTRTAAAHFQEQELPASMPNSTLPPLELLLSLPPCVLGHVPELRDKAFSDPPETKLGSGGGTAHLLHAAMLRDNAPDFRAWLHGSRKLLVHGGGQSRRLPAYAAVGKPLIPLPLFPNVYGQTSDQTLLTFQNAAFERVFEAAPASSVVMIASGDVLLRFGRKLPLFPDADVIALGMEVSPDVAQHFGVFFVPPKQPETCALFLQKPSPERIAELGSQYRFLVDTGMWLLSERAVLTLMAKCGWDDAEQRFENNLPRTYELYAEFGLALGTDSPVPDPDINALTCAVVPLPQPEFYHLGTSRQLIESVTALQNRLGKEGASHVSGLGGENTIHIQNAFVGAELRPAAHSMIWIENALIPESWTLHSDHVLTNIFTNSWTLDLPAGVCLDLPPIQGETLAMAVRVYGMDDPFSGRMGEESTQWFGRPAREWFARHGTTLEEAGISPDTDIQQAALFPVVPPSTLHTVPFLNWLIAAEPTAADNAKFRQLYLDSCRLSAQQIGVEMDIDIARQFREASEQALLVEQTQQSSSAFFRMDLGRMAHRFAQLGLVPPTEWSPNLAPMDKTHALMFDATWKRMQGHDDWTHSETAAFSALREAILTEAQLTPVAPHRAVLEDQIVWGRSPVRLDLAGGWTDTPPYCHEHGGKVVNLAVNLNGQPPVQVFIRLIETPEFVMRSIDQGREERVSTYAALDTYTQVGSAFALPKAALALCGFLPRFHHAEQKWKTLHEQLQDFGGGLEISLLAAVPAGSGLGTSSILASTILGTLNDVCGLQWDKFVLMERTLMVEQMLTTGGGWQDQAGGLFRGIKLLETVPGIRQEPTVRWLPEHLFAGEYANKANLLYYTGLTRLAKNILQEIVRGMFLNNREELEILRDLEANALATFDAVQRADWDGLCRCVAKNWTLNKRLDSGTNTEGVQAILNQIGDYLAGAKLLGAGGGGYLLMMAKDENAAARIRHSLTTNPPNKKSPLCELRLVSNRLGGHPKLKPMPYQKQNLLPLFGFIALMLCLPAFSGCGSKEPGVELYTDMDASIVKPLVAQWKNELGVPIRVTYAGDAKQVEKGIGLSQRIMEEKGAFKSDVYWARDAAAVQKLVDDGATTSANSEGMLSILETCRDTQGNWFGLGARVRVIVYNKQALAGKKPPQSLAALARPEWKDKTAMADPRLSGSSFYHLAVLYTAFSDADADALLGKIKDNGVQLLPSESAVIEAVSSGKAVWGVTDSDLAEKAAESGKIGYLASDQADHSTAQAMNKQEGDVYTLGTPALPCPVALMSSRPSQFEGDKLFRIMMRLPSAVTLAKTAPALLPTHNSLIENSPEARKGHPLNLGKLRLAPAKPAEIVKKQATLIVTLNSLFGTVP